MLSLASSSHLGNTPRIQHSQPLPHRPCAFPSDFCVSDFLLYWAFVMESALCTASSLSTILELESDLEFPPAFTSLPSRTPRCRWTSTFYDYFSHLNRNGMVCIPTSSEVRFNPGISQLSPRIYFVSEMQRFAPFCSLVSSRTNVIHLQG